MLRRLPDELRSADAPLAGGDQPPRRRRTAISGCRRSGELVGVRQAYGFDGPLGSILNKAKQATNFPGPITPLGSTGQCNTLVEYLCWCTKDCSGCTLWQTTAQNVSLLEYSHPAIPVAPSSTNTRDKPKTIFSAPFVLADIFIRTFVRTWLKRKLTLEAATSTWATRITQREAISHNAAVPLFYSAVRYANPTANSFGVSPPDRPHEASE